MRDRKQSRLKLLVPALALTIGVLGGTLLSAQTKSDEPAEYDTETCGACHTELVSDFAQNPHAALDSEAWKKAHGSSFACTNCHGDVNAHIEAGGGPGNIFAFGSDTTARQQSDVCLKCHGDVHPDFYRSPHAKAGLSCTSCHSVHASKGRARLLAPPQTGPEPARSSNMIIDPNSQSAVCQQCHGDIVARFGFNEHHRLQEGILECTTCHDPHSPATRNRLGGFKQMLCTQCHADKEGPFVFEHGSVRVEGCTACHDPHGSPNRHNLMFQRVAELCFSCHAEVPGFHTRFTLDTVCTNCHSSIHGSNFSPFFLK